MNRLFSTGWVMLLATLTSATAAAQQSQPADEIVVVVTALSPEASITLGSESATVGSTAGLYPAEPLAVEVKGVAQDAREAMLRIDALAASVISIRTPLELEVDDKRALTLRPQLGSDGIVDVYHETDSPPLMITIGQASVRLGRGVVRVRATGPDRPQFLCVSGSATFVFAGGAEINLDAAGKNSFTVDSTSAVAQAEAAGEVAATQSRVIQYSLLRDLVRVAESAAEGDIEPPARGSAVPIVAIATAVRVVDIVPRGTNTVTFTGTTGQSSSVAAQGASTAEAFLSSGQAALAVVGARIQATRIIGSTNGRAPLGVNNQFRRRFTLGAVNKLRVESGQVAR